jgi:hypothetical protein
MQNPPPTPLLKPAKSEILGAGSSNFKEAH